MPRASAVLCSLLVGLCWALPVLWSSETARAGQDRQKIAILEFEPATAKARASEKGRLVSEMLTTAAVHSGRFEVVERRIISRLLEELEFGERGLTYTSAALKVGAMAGATAIVGGSVAEDEGKTRIDARFIDVETGRILWAGVAMGTSSLSGVSDAAGRIFRDLAAYAAAASRDAGPSPAPGRSPDPATAQPPVRTEREAPAVPETATTAPESRTDTETAATPGVSPEAARQAAAHHQAAKEHGRARRYAQAAREMDQALALDPGRAEYLAARGHARSFLGRYAEALADYDQALAAHDAQAAVHSMRGLCLAALGRPEEALAAYDRASALAPGNPEVLVRRGRLLGTLGRTGEMCRDLASACDLGHCPPLETARKEGACPAAP